MRRGAAERGFDVPYHRHQARSNIVAQPVFREAECGRAAVKGVRTGAVIERERDADGMHVVLPLARRNREAELRGRFAGALDAVADSRPAAAVVLAKLAQ